MSSDQNLEQGESQGSKRMVTKVIRALSVWSSPRLDSNTERESDTREDENPEQSPDDRDIPDEDEDLVFPLSSERGELLSSAQNEIRFTPRRAETNDISSAAQNEIRFTPRRAGTNDNNEVKSETQRLSLREPGESSSTSCAEPLFYHGVVGYPAPYILPVSSPRLMPPTYASNIGRVHEAERSLYGETEASVRFGRVSVEKITRRETKRQSGRSRDVEYQRRFSSGSPVVIGSPQVPLGGVPWPREEIPVLPCRTQVTGELVASGENVFPYSPALLSKGGQNM
jgi:hypothetical protein